MSIATLKELANKFLDGIATEEEEQRLHDWYDNWQDDEEIVVTDTEESKEQLRKRMFAQVQARIGEFEKPLVVKMHQPRKVWSRYAAAILILITGSYFFLNQGQPKKDLAENKSNIPANDIAPGGNKATLTLANGTTIILDTAQNGTLTQQGNIKIIKLDDGQLAYDQSVVTNKEEILYNTISTPRGGQYQLTLSDGSKVWLNAESSLRFPASFTGKERKVELTGEGYFEVAHNVEKPFHVSVNGADVQVLGTHFNVNAYENEETMKATLLEGSVQLSKGNESVKIMPGEQAVIKNISKISVRRNVNLEEVMAWKNGYFEFEETNLSTIMRQINRWYDVEVVYPDNYKDAEKFGGRISKNLSLREMLHLLESNGVSFNVVGRKLIIENIIK